MIIVRLLSPGPFGWLAPPKFTRVQGADIVMESITPTTRVECWRGESGSTQVSRHHISVCLMIPETNAYPSAPKGPSKQTSSANKNQDVRIVRRGPATPTHTDSARNRLIAVFSIEPYK